MFKKQQGIQYIDLKSKSGEHRKFIKVKYLGAGGFARCYQVFQQANQQKKHYALKIIKKSTILQSKQLIDRLKTQIRLHKKFSQPSQISQSLSSHQHIARFIQSFQTQQFIYLLLQLCGNQTLNQLIRRRKFLSQQQTRFFIYQLAKGLKQIHSKNVVHRDIKLCNLFLSQGLKLKIGDFGLATEIIESRKRLTICGTANYIAPEMLKKDENGSPLGHLYEVDIWSLGVVCYTIFYGCYPFQSKQQQSIYNKILQCKYNLFPYTLKQMRELNTTDHSASNDMKDFLQNILVIEPTKRLNLQQVLSHTFLTKTGIPRQLPNIALKCALRKDTLQKIFVQNEQNYKISINKQNSFIIENQQNEHKKMVCDQIDRIEANGVQNDKSKQISFVNKQSAIIRENSNGQKSGSEKKQQLTNCLSLNQCKNRNDIQKQQHYPSLINSKKILRFKLKRSCNQIEDLLKKGLKDQTSTYQNEERILIQAKSLTLQVVFQSIQSKSAILPTVIKVFEEQQGQFSNLYTLIIHPKLNYLTKIMDRTPLNQISRQKNVDLKNDYHKQTQNQAKPQKQQENNTKKKKSQPDFELKLLGQQDSYDFNINKQRVCVKIPLIKEAKHSCMDKNQQQQGVLLHSNELYNGFNETIYKQEFNVVKQVFRYLKGYEI